MSYDVSILIGREDGTNRLAIEVNGQKYTAAGKEGCVPLTVSRLKRDRNTGHCRIYTRDSYVFVENLNPQNITLVNDYPIDGPTKITARDTVALGYPSDSGKSFAINTLDMLKASGWKADVHHLVRIWKDYNEASENIDIAAGRSAAIRSMLPILTIGGSALPWLFPGLPEATRWILTGVMLLFTVFFAVRGMSKSNMVPIKKKKLTEELRRNYVCPYCRKHFGQVPSHELISAGKCPACGISYRPLL